MQINDLHAMSGCPGTVWENGSVVTLSTKIVATEFQPKAARKNKLGALLLA